MSARGRIAIIGAGPAGGAAAIHLARTGFDVTLIEAKAFPRTKVCGEFVSPAATAYLESVLSPDELASAGASRCDRLRLHLGKRTIDWRMPARAWVLSRRSLDALLVEKARSLGVRVLQPAAVRSVEYGDTSVRIDLASSESVDAEMVVHADGSGRHDHPHGHGPAPSRAGVIGLKAHLELPADVHTAALGMRSARGAYIGTVGIEHARTTIALVARAPLYRELVRTSSSPDEAADRLVQHAWPVYRSAWRREGWLACGVAGSGYRSPGHARSLRLGNAAAAVEPVGGEGIGLALWSAHTLGGLLGSHSLLHPSELEDVQRVFARKYRARLRLRRPMCRAAAFMLEKPAIVRTLWPLLEAFPGTTIRPAYHLTGKPMRAAG